LLDAPLRATMSSMQPASVHRLVLLAPPKQERDPKIRRYRLARLKLEDREEHESRFSHLKRVYD
jgi:hypothetical protein